MAEHMVRVMAIMMVIMSHNRTHNQTCNRTHNCPKSLTLTATIVKHSIESLQMQIFTNQKRNI